MQVAFHGALNGASRLERRGLLLAALLLIVANLLTLLSGWFVVAGVLILGILLPGALCAAWLLRRAMPPLLEWIAYSLGLGYALYIVAMLFVTDLPGPIAAWQVRLTLSALSLALAIGYFFALRTPAQQAEKWEAGVTGSAGILAGFPSSCRQPSVHNRWAMVGLVSALLVAALLRFPNLGYSDFLGDEARAMLFATDAIQGYPTALLVHKKGPTEILIPLGIYAVENQITESQARFPFALAGMLGIFALYLLGWRLFGAVAGWIAAMLLAVDGYFIAFARIVQYQSIVFCMTVLIALALYRQARAHRPLPSYLLMAGLFFVASLYSHYEAIWVLIPALFWLGLYVRRTGDFKGLLAALVVPLLLSVALVAIFYLPFVMDSHWGETAEYLFDHRIQSSFPYNGLQEFFERTIIYDSSYFFFFLLAMTVISQVVVLRKVWPGWLVGLIAALTLAGLAITFLVRPNWLVLGNTDHTWFFFALATLVIIFAPRVTAEERMVWLWFGLAMVLSIFFVAKPNTHVYSFFIPWALVVGLAGEELWRGLAGWIGVMPARWVALPISALLIALFGYYTYLIFTYTGVEIFRTWATNRPAGYWTPFDLPTQGDLFGLPYKNGWKVIGALYADGTLDAPFDSTETNRVADWYDRNLAFCPVDAEYYMLPTTQQPDDALQDPAKVAELAASGFQPWGVITVDGDPRMRIFSKHAEAGDQPLRSFEESDYAARFDDAMTSPVFVKRGPTMIAQPANPVNYRLGEGMWLKGYTLSQTQVAPGERLQLQLFWEATTPQRRGDKTFIQLIDLNTLHKAAQRDNEPGCGVYHLGEWRPGDLNLDPYTLTIAPDTPPGKYTLLVGAYDQDNEDHYPVFAPDGSPIGDSIQLASIDVVAPD